MSYQKRRDIVFRGETKSLYIVFISLAVVLAVALFFSEKGVQNYWLLFPIILILLLAWLLVRVLIKKEKCNSCEYDIGVTVIQLGKASESGYCPKCGNEIV